MFYTAIQNGEVDRWNGERFVCFEADSQEEANQRAEWFGIDFTKTYGRYNHKLWQWHEASCGLLSPGVNNIPIASCTARYGGHWIVVFKSGNLRSSLAIPLNAETDPGDSHDPVEAT